MTEYELAQLPKSETGRRMYNRVSPVYENSRFMKQFYDAMGEEWDKFRWYFTTLREQHFIQTVDYGIEYLEHRYSLEPRPDLTLEERRARLGIRATKKFPLNPAILEKYALDNYDLKCYLDESDPGYIHMWLNFMTEEDISGWTKYLITEKPAHLALDGALHIYYYVGTYGNLLDDWFKIRQPREHSLADIFKADVDLASSTEPFTPLDLTKGNLIVKGWTPERKLVRPHEIPYPKDAADKKRFPRIFAGVTNICSGVSTMTLPKPKSAKGNIYVGNAALITGNAGGVSIDKPRGFTHKLRVGIPMMIGGEFTLSHNPNDITVIKQPRESGIADLMIADIGLARMAETPPLLDTPKQIVKMRVGHTFRVMGGITLGTSTLDDMEELPTGNWIKLYFDFPISKHYRYRGIALPNPRTDLTKDEIKAVGDYAAEHQLILNEAGEYSNGVVRAAIRTTQTRKIIL